MFCLCAFWNQKITDLLFLAQIHHELSIQTAFVTIILKIKYAIELFKNDVNNCLCLYMRLVGYRQSITID